MKKFIKMNKLPLLVLAFVFLFCIYTFYSYHKNAFSYSKYYYQLKEVCTEDLSNAMCKRFHTKEKLELYLEDRSPEKKYQQLDVITLTSTLVEIEAFSIMQLMAPLLIIIAVVGRFHASIKTGMIQNYLMRMSYRDYIQKDLKNILVIAGILPLSLLFLFFIALIFVKGDFTVHESVLSLSVYDEWKYNHFFLYGFIILLIQYFLGIFYGIIAMICSYRNKNTLISILTGYLSYIVIYLFIYIILYVFIINKLLGFTNLTDYFLISGFWFFDSNIWYPAIFFIIFLLLLFSFLTLLFMIRKKEKVMILNDKITA